MKTPNKGEEKPFYQCKGFDKLTDKCISLLTNVTTGERIAIPTFLSGQAAQVIP